MLQPSDRYIAHLLCPSLLCVDRMKSDTVARMAHKMKTRLTPQVKYLGEYDLKKKC